MDFIGTRWEELTLDDVREFLANAGDEGRDWETKGTEMPRAERVRKTVCGLTNQAGGFFIIGAQRDEQGVWIADGVAFGHREPGAWTQTCCVTGTTDCDRNHFST
jgi:predicted HTH transcriptional regulator